MAFDQADLTYQTIWAGNGLYSSFARVGGARDGLMRSNDGGTIWTRITGGGVLTGKNISGIVANGSTIVVSVSVGSTPANTSFGIFRSTDSVATFSQVNDATASAGLPYGRSYDLVADPRDPSTLYTSNAIPPTAGDEGIYKSTNAGATWSRVSTAAMDALFAANTSNVEWRPVVLAKSMRPSSTLATWLVSFGRRTAERIGLRWIRRRPMRMERMSA